LFRTTLLFFKKKKNIFFPKKTTLSLITGGFFLEFDFELKELNFCSIGSLHPIVCTCMRDQKVNFKVDTKKIFGLQIDHSASICSPGHRVRHHNRRSRVQIPPGCKVFQGGSVL
jgi:hypothetical protein